MLKRLDSEEIRHSIQTMVGVAESIAGGSLPTLHERYRPEIKSQLMSVVAPLARDLIWSICADTDYVQAVPNLRLHMPITHDSTNDGIPFHSDVLYGHSPAETNYWLTMTPIFGSNSLRVVEMRESERLHETLRAGCSMAAFQNQADKSSLPIRCETPGLFTFCCAQVHGSVANGTDVTRVSFDIRTIPADATHAVKKKGGYFRPKWFTSRRCPIPDGMPVTTIASLDLPARVDHQRLTMQSFFPQGQHQELVEYHGLDHAPTIAEAVRKGPVVLYSIHQWKYDCHLRHAVGFADQKIWLNPGDDDVLARMLSECADEVGAFTTLPL